MKLLLNTVLLVGMAVTAGWSANDETVPVDGKLDDAHVKDAELKQMTPVDQGQLILSVGCDEEILLTFDIIPADTYQASQTIFASGRVTNGEVILRAGESVSLGAQFQVDQGARLQILIGECVL